MHALPLRAEQAQHLGRLRPGAAEPMRDPRVELGDLAGLHDEVVLGQQEPQLPREHVHPLIALVDLCCYSGNEICQLAARRPMVEQ